jgi:hypothetical protein
MVCGFLFAKIVRELFPEGINSVRPLSFKSVEFSPARKILLAKIIRSFRWRGNPCPLIILSVLKLSGLTRIGGCSRLERREY